MNILPQIYKNVLKERIKNKILEFSDEFIDILTDNLFNVSKNLRYVEMISGLQNKASKLLRAVIIETFEEIDKQFKVNPERIKRYTINKSNVPRTLITIFGEITYKRTYYISRLDKKKHFILDEIFDIPAYDHYDPIIKAITIDKAMATNQCCAGKDTGELITNIKNLMINRDINHIPRQSVYYWLNKWETPKIIYEETTTPSTLYIMADEKFIGCQDLENDIMGKCMISFEDVKKTTKNRNKLCNKTIYTTYSKKPWEEFVDILAQKYDFSKIKHIYLLGDGASWIRSGVEELRIEPNIKITFLLCEFHYKQAINHITSDKDERKKLIEIFETKSKSVFKKEIDKIILDNPKRETTITKKRDYILNNYKPIKMMLKSHIGSSMESHISHYVSSKFASRPKGYSSLNINKYFRLNDYSNNNINLINLYIKSYNNKEEITLNQDNFNDTIFTDKHTLLPILDQGYSTSTCKTIQNILN